MSTAVVLTCKHTLIFRYGPPRVGERIYCTLCEDMRAVTGGPGDWRVICNNCTARRTRINLPPIAKFAREHLHTHPTHTLTVWQIGNEADAVTVQQTDAATGGPVLSEIESPNTLL